MRSTPGVIACSALYPDIERFAPVADIHYVPQELHEFPANVPDEHAIRSAIQSAIDSLDTAERDRIYLYYANSSSLGPFTTAHASIIHAPVIDCIDVLLDRPIDERTGETKTPETYYHSRGTIDSGVDAYKLYTAYTGEVDELIEWFHRARALNPDLRITWPEGERFKETAERGRLRPATGIDQVFSEIVGGFNRVCLIDTGSLTEFHLEYANRFCRFLESLPDGRDESRSVALTHIDGDISLFEALRGEQSLDELVDDGFHIERPNP